MLSSEACHHNDRYRQMNESKTYIALSDPKSPANVGAVMRAAGCFGADAVFYTGNRYARSVV